MQAWYKQARNRIFLYFIILVILVGLVSAIDDCKGTLTTDEIPCNIIYPYSGNCSTLTLAIYNHSTLLGNNTLLQYSPFECNDVFTYKYLGTYTGNFSVYGDTFILTVIGGTKMITLFYFALAIAIIMLVLGLYQQDATFLNFSGIIFFLMGVYILMYGYSELNNLMTWIIASVCWGLGLYIIIRTNVETAQAALGD